MDGRVHGARFRSPTALLRPRIATKGHRRRDVDTWLRRGHLRRAHRTRIPADGCIVIAMRSTSARSTHGSDGIDLASTHPGQIPVVLGSRAWRVAQSRLLLSLRALISACIFMA
jgi:hypothetical protein